MRLLVVEVGARERVRPDLGKSKEARPLQSPRAQEARQWQSILLATILQIPISLLQQDNQQCPTASPTRQRQNSQATAGRHQANAVVEGKDEEEVGGDCREISLYHE